MGSRDVDPAELHFLLLHFLSAGPCQSAAKVLEEEAVAKGLLPSRTDIFGVQHSLSYAELQERYAHMPASAIADMLHLALVRKRDAGMPGVTSILHPGKASVVPSLAAEAYSTAVRKLPGWLRAPHLNAPMVQRLKLRQIGASAAARSQRALLPPAEYAGKVQHQRSVRGHSAAVYCVTFDRVGNRLITGSDDTFIKIWSTETALLLCTCRGHRAEVTDLAVNVDNTLFASSSNDHTVRCWSLEPQKLGETVSLLTGHRAVVSFVEFCPVIPHALLSCSFDGTCRIWNARNAAAEPLILSARPNFAASPSHSTRTAQEAQAVHPLVANPAENTIIGAEDSHVASIPGIPGLLVCAFSKDGAYIVSGANDCNTYVWHWDLWASSDFPSVRSSVYSPTSLGDGLRQPKWAPGAAAGAAWPQPQEVCRLMGHRHDVLLLQFSHDGESIATGSKDGSVRVWRRERKMNSVKGWVLEATFACLPDPEEVRQASKRRRPPPSPSVNQIAWSCDDTKILASVTDSSVRVWDTRTGEPLYDLREHKGDAFVLECHPTDSRIAISGAYDGTICMWDLATGKKMASFSTQDTCPGGRRWVDPIPMLDGHFTPDGAGFVVTDVAGQVHLYATGTPAATSHVPYDQFFIQELRPVPPPLPAEGELPAAPQEPAPFRPHTHMLCDSLVNIYPDPFQRAFQIGRVSALPPLCVLEVSELPSGIVQNNPVVTAAAWTAQEHGGSEAAIQNAMQRAQQRMLNADEEFMRATEPRPAGAPRSAAAVRAAAAAAALYDSDVAEMEIGAVSDGDYADDSEFTGNGEADSDADFDSDQVEEEAPLERVPAPSRRYRSAPALSTRAHERVPLPEPAAPRYRTRRHGDVEEPEQPQLRSRQPRRVAARNQRGAATIPSDDESDAELAAAIAASAREQTMVASSPEPVISSDDDAGPSAGASLPLPPLPSAPHTRAGGSSSRTGTANRGSRISAREKRQRDREEAEARASKRRRTVRRRAEDDYAVSEDDDGVDSNVDSEEEYSEGSELEEKVEEEEAEEGDMEDSEDEAARAVEAQRRVEARERRAGLAHSQEEATKPGAADAMPRGMRGAKPREAHMYEWLQVAQQVPSVYVPQMGDEVVYLRTGHQRFLDSQNDKRPPPWEYLTAESGAPLREAEPCTVVGLSYLIADDGMDATYASLKLRLDDVASPMKGGHFYVRLPPPFVGGADFVVPKSRFDAAIRRKWTIDDHCQVYYPDEVKFWNGIVINDNRDGGEDQVQADPYSCGGLWERFTVTWDSTVVNPGAAAPSDDHISPWEMFDAGLDSDHVLEEAPTISLELRTRLLAAVKRVVREPRFEIFASSPGINVYYSGSSTDRLFYNRRVPLPLALTEVEARLSSLYYRQPAAVSQDLKVIYENAVSFNGADSVIAKDAKDLMTRLQSVVEGNPLPAAQPEVGTGLQSTRRRLPVGALAEREFSAPSETAARRARISIRMPSGSILGTEEDAALSEVAGIGLLPAPIELPARNQTSNPPYPEQSRVPRARGRPRRGTHPTVSEPVPSPRRQRTRRVYREAYDSGSEDVEEESTPPRHNARHSMRSRRGHDRRGSPEVEPPASESRRPQRAAAAAARFKFEYGGSDEELASEEAPLPPRGRPQRTVRMMDVPPQHVVAPTVQQPDLSSVLLRERPEHGYLFDPAELPSSAGQGGPAAGVSAHEGGWTEDVRRGKRSSRSRAHPEIHGFEMAPRVASRSLDAATGQPGHHTLGEGSWANMLHRPLEGGGLPGVSGRELQDSDPWAGQGIVGTAAAGNVPTALPTANFAAEPDLLDTSAPVHVSAAPSDFEYHSAGSGLASDNSGGARAGISNGQPPMDGLQTAALPFASNHVQNGRFERLDSDLPDTHPRQPLRIKLKLPHLV